MFVNAVMITTAIRAAISPYSMAVAPASSRIANANQYVFRSNEAEVEACDERIYGCFAQIVSALLGSFAQQAADFAAIFKHQ